MVLVLVSYFVLSSAILTAPASRTLVHPVLTLLAVFHQVM